MGWATDTTGVRQTIASAIKQRILTRRPVKPMDGLHAEMKLPSPHEPGRLRDTAELHPLILGRHTVTGHRRGEPALRAEREPLEWNHPRGFLDARAQLVDGLDPRLLRRDQPEHHDPVVGHDAERLEAARALVVVFEQ